MKKISAVLFILTALSVFGVTGSAFACGKGQCAMKGGYGHGMGMHGGMKSGCPVTAKLMYKAYFFLANQKELGLKEDQVRAIKAIKLEAKKAAIRQMAEMQVFHLDMKAKLSEPTVDVEGINKMIDSMSSAMAVSGKEMVASYAKLKGVLTAEQMAKAKEIWQKQEEAEHAQ